MARVRAVKRLDASYYNKDYFRPGPKSDYMLPVTWEVEEDGCTKAALSIRDIFHPTNVLDVGCAKGFMCKAFLQLGIDACGCDISEFAVGNCEPEVKGRLKVADIRDGLPYPPNSFDLVLAAHTLEHIEMEFLPNVAAEIARVSRRWILISVPLGRNNENISGGDPSHRTLMPASYWILLFYEQGLVWDLDFSQINIDLPFPGATLAFFKDERKDLKEETVENYILPFKPTDSVLEVGGGDKPYFRPNLDCRQLPTVDIVADLNQDWSVESESYEGVFGNFILEHISWRNVRSFISETHRVLRPSGIAVIITSNLLEQAKLLVDTPEWDDQLVCMIFGGNDYPENTHRCGLSPQYAIKLFTEAGFSSITIYEHPVAKAITGRSTDMIIEARKSAARIMRSL